MAIQAVEVKCPNCGSAVAVGQKTCIYCKQPVVISTFNSVYQMPMPALKQFAEVSRQSLLQMPDDVDFNNSYAMCCLKLKLYDKALEAFRKVIDSDLDNTEAYFYAAICLLQGKKAFVAQRTTINKIEEYLDAATMIEPRGIYYYFLAYVKYDFFKRKCLNTRPSHVELLAEAEANGVSDFDTQQLFRILGVENPL